MSGSYTCTACDAPHDNVHSHEQHGLCPRCRDRALDDTRSSGCCCRCGEFVRPLTSFGSEWKDKDRFLSCPKCALVLTRDPADHVRGINHDNARSA